jgi:hypothetical protein
MWGPQWGQPTPLFRESDFYPQQRKKSSSLFFGIFEIFEICVCVGFFVILLFTASNMNLL